MEFVQRPLTVSFATVKLDGALMYHRSGTSMAKATACMTTPISASPFHRAGPQAAVRFRRPASLPAVAEESRNVITNK